MEPTYFILIELSKLMDSANSRILSNTRKIGGILGLSQQSASRHLNKLEKDGLITKRMVKGGQEIRLTPKALEILEGIQTDLKRFIESKGSGLTIEGVISSGIGEGAHYVRKYSKRIRDYTGYTPYPGTLNIRVEAVTELRGRAAHSIRPFTEGGRTYGRLDLIPVELSHGGDSVECHLIVPERTHHRNILEIISRHDLRRRLGLKDGSEVKVRISR